MRRYFVCVVVVDERVENDISVQERLAKTQSLQNLSSRVCNI